MRKQQFCNRHGQTLYVNKHNDKTKTWLKRIDFFFCIHDNDNRVLFATKWGMSNSATLIDIWFIYLNRCLTNITRWWVRLWVATEHFISRTCHESDLIRTKNNFRLYSFICLWKLRQVSFLSFVSFPNELNKGKRLLGIPFFHQRVEFVLVRFSAF